MEPALLNPTLKPSVFMTDTERSVVATAILADDHEMVRAGLRAMLQQAGRCDVIGESADGRSAVRLARELSPDLIILDVMLPLLNGIEATRQIVSENRDARVIICSADHKQTLIEESLRAGASAFLLKSSAGIELTIAIGAVMRGEVYLSPKAAEIVVDKYIRQLPRGAQPLTNLSVREREVLQLLTEGKSNKQIGTRLDISVRTVEAHRTQVMEKLNLRSVAELTKYAIREGITTLEA